METYRKRLDEEYAFFLDSADGQDVKMTSSKAPCKLPDRDLFHGIVGIQLL